MRSSRVLVVLEAVVEVYKVALRLEELVGSIMEVGDREVLFRHTELKLLACGCRRTTSAAARGSLGESGTSLVRADVGGLALGESEEQLDVGFIRLSECGLMVELKLLAWCISSVLFVSMFSLGRVPFLWGVG